jgi:hypothetical protein
MAFDRPGNLSGINYGHFAGGNVKLAVVADAQALPFDLVTNQQAVALAAAPVMKTIPFLGRAFGSPSYNTPGAVKFARAQSTGARPYTAAVMFQHNGVSNGDTFGLISAGGAAEQSGSQTLTLAGTGSSANLSGFDGGNGAFSVGGLAALPNIPYFYAVSSGGGTLTGVLKRLDTGTVQSATVTGGGNGTNGVNASLSDTAIGAFGSNASWGGAIAMAYLAYRALSRAELLAWAEDPWGLFEWDDEELPELAVSGAAAAVVALAQVAWDWVGAAIGVNAKMMPALARGTETWTGSSVGVGGNTIVTLSRAAWSWLAQGLPGFATLVAGIGLVRGAARGLVTNLVRGTAERENQ